MAWKRNRSPEDFNEEIQAHLQLEADRLIEEGMERDKAMAAARRAFGNVTSTEERFYESSRWIWLDHLFGDIRYALRQMKRMPLSTGTIVLSLAVGIGVNTAIFSLADQILVRALPVHDPGQLVQLHWNGRFIGGGLGVGSLIPHPLYRELREEQEVFVDLFARSPAEVTLSIDAVSERVNAEVVTGSYFPTLGIRPAVGRLFNDQDNLVPDTHPVMVLSYDYWRGRFGADSTLIGRQLRMNGYPMTVVGVAQPGFHGTDWSRAPAIWVPMMMNDRVIGRGRLNERRERFLHVYARLPEGVSRKRAETQLQPWFRNYLHADTEREGWPGVNEQRMQEYLASTLDLLSGRQGQSQMQSRFQQPVLILVAATTLLLLLACLNVANLSLARTLARRRAIALRTALGASRARIVKEQLIESGLLAGAGGIAGVLLAPPVARSVLSYLRTASAPWTGDVSLSANLDMRVLVFALGITVLVTLLSGATPAFFAASVRPVTALKAQSSGIAGGLGLRKTLVVGQFALALILLIGAGLFARTLGTLRALGPGFSTTNLLMFQVTPVNDGYELGASKPVLRSVLTEVQALPDVEQVGVGLWELLSGGGWGNPVTVESSQRVVSNENESIPMNAVTAGFFAALGTPITLGRDFDARDIRNEPGWGLRSAIVSEEFVRRYIPVGNPVGARVAIGRDPNVVPSIEIVGVVKSFRDHGLRELEPQIFFSLWERSVGTGTFYVRTRSSLAATARAIRAAVNRVDPVLVLTSLRTLEDQLDRLLVYERMLAMLAGAFAVIATLLAMIGLYGVLTFSAACRTKEMGIRLALGAPRWSAGGLIVREAAALGATGLTIALPASWALGRLIENRLFGVRPMDWMTVAGAAMVLALAWLVASAVPARKAETVNPLDALRTD